MTDNVDAEAKYRQLFDTLIEGFCTIEVLFDAQNHPTDYRFLEINPAFERQTGLHDAQGKLMRELAPNHEQHWFDIYGKIALTGEPLRFENEARALGRFYEVCAYRVGGAQSRKVAILFNDITERKNSERKLRAQVERMNLLHQITRAIGEHQDTPSIFQVVIRTLEDQLPIDFGCICLYDAAANDVMIASMGLRSAKLAVELNLTEQSHVNIGDDCIAKAVLGQLIYEPDTAKVDSPFPRLLAQGSLYSMVAAPMLVEGEVFGVLLVARHLSDSFSSGECEFLTHLSEHVALAAQHAQLYGALQGAYDDLRDTQAAIMQQERLRALGQMASGIAHDINNAISPVSLYTEALLEREEALSNTGRGQLQIIQRAVGDVAQTVARMREFYRPREPQKLLARVALNELVQQVIALTRVRWHDIPQERGVTIELVKELATPLPAVLGAESEIRDALTNLVFNAVDAMPNGGKLTIETANTRLDRNYSDQNAEVVPGQYVALAITDNGCGMSKDVLARVFEPFYTTKDIGQGTGLGLSQVYGFVKQSGGHVKIYSEPDEGTTVRIYLPRLQAHETEVSVAPVREYSVLGSASEAILVVEDDDDVRRHSTQLLTEMGYRVFEAPNGQAALEILARQEDIKLVFTDIGLPGGMNGRQLADEAQRRWPKLRVLFTTGYARNAIVHDGRLDPGVSLITKPFTYGGLAAKIAEMLSGDMSGRCVLVVEDDEQVRRVIVDALTELGYRVEEAATAMEAANRIRSAGGYIDAVVIDIGLPDRRGDTLAAELRALHAKLPIVIASGYAETPLQDRFKHDPYFKFLTKPYDTSQLAIVLTAMAVEPADKP